MEKTEWVGGYVVWVLGRGYVQDIHVRPRQIDVSDDMMDALVFETWGDAVLCQHWVLDLLNQGTVSGKIFAVTICPLVFSVGVEVEQ